jgi:hypothetical protein
MREFHMAACVFKQGALSAGLLCACAGVYLSVAAVAAEAFWPHLS